MCTLPVSLLAMTRTSGWSQIDEVVEECVEFADASPNPGKGQLLENVFSDPRGFGIGENGQYRYLQPGFTSGEAEMS